ncbi:MAG: NAD(P)/FAD-dependent oxidoreductase, partial [Pseudomonadota bacterium]
MNFDVVVIGAGAAGLMAAARAGVKGKSVLIIDHSDRIAEKIRISGGGRCNFTNMHTSPANFISNNPHFCKSALARYTQHDFVSMVKQYNIAYHEKTKGQLFCDDSAKQIIDMLLAECKNSNVTIWTDTRVKKPIREDNIFYLDTDKGPVETPALVVACGGLSIPKIGASPFGYNIAREFGLKIIEPTAALVPLTFDTKTLDICNALSGISVDPVIVRVQSMSFEEAMLFTHRGLSGPAILQISSYWNGTEPISINLLPALNVLEWLKAARKEHPRKQLLSIVEMKLPNRLADALIGIYGDNPQMANIADKKLQDVANLLSNWQVTPIGTEGYRTAEVTFGGVDTNEISSKTFESKKVSGLYFIGEVVDVTGHL